MDRIIPDPYELPLEIVKENEQINIEKERKLKFIINEQMLKSLKRKKNIKTN